MKEIIVVSDVHYADVWDEIDKLIPKKYHFLNSNTYLKKIIKMIKPKQHLVINGDQVDFHYANYYPRGKTNWTGYNKIIKKCKGKVDATFGNHDYKSHPYNLWISGINHLNISRKIQNKYLKTFTFTKFRFLGELNSFLGNVKDKLKNQVTNFYYSSNLNKQKMIFLNSGQDVFNLFAYLNPRRWSDMFIRPPYSVGLSDKQLNFLKKELNVKKEKLKKIKEHLIFLHAPPFFSPKKITPMKITKKIISLNYGTFHRNSFDFVKTVMKSVKNIIVITSHNHAAKHYLIDKKKNLLLESTIEEVNKLRNDSRFVKFISTLPLGAIEPLNKKLGYLLIGKKIEHKVIVDYANL
jgi:hypothetical protein